MANYQEAKVKLTNNQLNKLKSVAKSKTGTILRINEKYFQDEELSHELFLTTRQTTKIRNAIAKNRRIGNVVKRNCLKWLIKLISS